MYRILIVDDEEDVVSLLKDYLELNRYETLSAGNGTEALEKIKWNPDLILLDINMPGMDGLSVCRQIRDYVNCPIIFLTARIEDADKIKGFAAGGDDYMVKPFSVAVMKIRLRNILGRRAMNAGADMKDSDVGAEDMLVSGDVIIDRKMFRASLAGQELDLSMTEFRLLQYLMENKNQALLKEQILQRVWDVDGNYVEENTLSVNISRLRKKLGGSYIRTIQGIGYLWEEKT